MNKQQQIERQQHRFAETGTIERVTAQEQGYQIDSSVGSFLLREPSDPPPAAGMDVTFYRHDGHGIQGVDINNKPVFFKTTRELEKERLEWLRQNEIKKAEE